MFEVIYKTSLDEYKRQVLVGQKSITDDDGNRLNRNIYRCPKCHKCTSLDKVISPERPWYASIPIGHRFKCKHCNSLISSPEYKFNRVSRALDVPYASTVARVDKGVRIIFEQMRFEIGKNSVFFRGKKTVSMLFKSNGMIIGSERRGVYYNMTYRIMPFLAHMLYNYF